MTDEVLTVYVVRTAEPDSVVFGVWEDRGKALAAAKEYGGFAEVVPFYPSENHEPFGEVPRAP